MINTLIDELQHHTLHCGEEIHCVANIRTHFMEAINPLTVQRVSIFDENALPSQIPETLPQLLEAITQAKQAAKDFAEANMPESMIGTHHRIANDVHKIAKRRIKLLALDEGWSLPGLT